MADLIGEACVQGIAFGRPVVPDEKRMLLGSIASIMTDSKSWVVLFRKSFHEMSPSLSVSTNVRPFSGKTTQRAASASLTRAYSGSVRSPRAITSCVKTSCARAIDKRTSISDGEKLSAMPTTTMPAFIIPKYTATDSAVITISIPMAAPFGNPRFVKPDATRLVRDSSSPTDILQSSADPCF
eukprot:814914_1